MDRELIIRLAREAGLEILSLDGEDEVGCGDGYHIQTDLIERFAALVVANNPPQSWMSYQEGYEAGQQAGRIAEREECAKVCDEYNDGRYANTADLCAAAIRSRT